MMRGRRGKVMRKRRVEKREDAGEDQGIEEGWKGDVRRRGEVMRGDEEEKREECMNRNCLTKREGDAEEGF